MVRVTDQHLFTRRDAGLELVALNRPFGLGEEAGDLLQPSTGDAVAIP